MQIPSEKEILTYWDNSHTSPLLSVALITYNHDGFIAQAIESVLIQKTNFPFELIIHDDASKDNTQKIIKEYAVNYPNIIKPILQKENYWLGKGINATTTIVFPSAKGKYIAWLEGDDYWIDPLKLQKQVDFLEANEDYSICFHDIYASYPNKELEPDKFMEERYHKIKDKNNITYKDLLEQGNFINTCSVVFRNKNLVQPEYFRLSPVGDYLLHISNSLDSKIKKIEGRMGVYRRGIGVYSQLDSEAMGRKKIEYNIVLFAYLENFEDKKLIFNKILKELDILKQQSEAKCFRFIKKILFDLKNAIKNNLKF